jgi:predicted metal-dependent phosphoesterase TrpH
MELTSMMLDLHVHSNYSIDCAEPVEKVVAYARKKVDGIAITDHNEIEGALRGRQLWENVIVGEEVETHEGEILAYHIQEKIKSRDIDEAIDEIKSQGGLVGVSHPYDVIRKNAIRKGALTRIMERLDFIEGINARCLFFFNTQAKTLARKNTKPMIAGSDAHFAFEVGNAWTEADFELKHIGAIHLAVSPLYPLVRLSATKLYKIRKGVW